MHEFFDDITPHPEGIDPQTDLIHERAYVVRAYRKDDATLWLRGAIRDQKPPGLYIEDDPEPLTVHHMILDLHIEIPTLEITWANVAMETHPHENCPQIEDHYHKLIGLSIARGFTHKIRELFGGPRGCTHTTALLQAMAPVAVQSMWSIRMGSKEPPTSDGRARAMATNINTCHIWSEDGEQVASIRRGEPMDVPVWIKTRYAQLGRDPRDWQPDR